MESDDKKLIRQFLDGDDSAFPELVKKYLKPIYNFLYQLTSDKSILDDLVQETFLKTWKNMHRFDQSRNFKIWIFAIARNTAYDYFKKKKTLPFSLFTDQEGRNPLEEISEDKILPEELLARADLAAELEKKISEIPKAYRVILIMRYKEDFSLSEIAKILGVSYNTVKSQHNRALLRLKKLLEQR
jgi:RNA polymerase sigma-70 factor, ECF subfamily